MQPTHIHWTEAGQACSALWRSERGAAPPKRVVLADDTTTADDAYHLACEGTALLWRGDFQNARQLLQALARRIDKTPQRKQRAAKGAAIHKPPVSAADGFNLHRQAQAQRARVLAMVLLPFDADYSIPLPSARETAGLLTAGRVALASAAGVAGSGSTSLASRMSSERPRKTASARWLGTRPIGSS